MGVFGGGQLRKLPPVFVSWLCRAWWYEAGCWFGGVSKPATEMSIREGTGLHTLLGVQFIVEVFNLMFGPSRKVLETSWLNDG